MAIGKTINSVVEYKNSLQNNTVKLRWRRNQFWPAYEFKTGSNKLGGLVAIFKDRVNLFSISVTTSSGTWNIDYGDGTTATPASGQVTYTYDYNASALNDTNCPVTFTTGTNLVTRTNHGIMDGDKVSFYTMSGTTSIIEAKTYYAINVTSNTFQVSETRGGYVVTINSSGSGALLPYKIALVTVTPGAGNITTFNISVTPVGITNSSYTSMWLDFTMAIPTITSYAYFGNQGITHNNLEIVNVADLGTSNTLINLCHTVTSLKKLSITADTSSVTNISGMCQNCYLLEEAPAFNTSNVTQSSSTYDSCYNLKYVPRYDLSKVTTTTSMFGSCYNIEYIPDLNFTSSLTFINKLFSNCRRLRFPPHLGNTANVTNMSGLFNNCTSLEDFDYDLDCTSATNMSSIFQGCYNLTRAPRLIGMANCTSISSMFFNCSRLEIVPQINTASARDFNNLFNNCYKLTFVPTLDFSSANNASGCFQFTPSLKRVNIINSTNKIVNVNNMFNNSGIIEVPNVNMSNTSINAFNAFNVSYNMERCKAIGIANNTHFTNNLLSNTALNEIFTNLATVSGKTIVITNNYGAATCNTAIATSKGWTVTG